MSRFRRATREVLPRAGGLSWLLLQSLHTHGERLQLLRLLGMPTRVLDVGAGTGAMSLDLAWLLGEGAQITAVDNDPAALSLLGEMATQLGLPVARAVGSVYALPSASRTQHLTIARFLLQHLEHPADALLEMARVTAPGGRVVVNAVDDGTSLTEPPLPPAHRRLYEAIAELQARRGGNRHIGRHLYHLMRGAGLVDLQILLLPRMRLGTTHGRNDDHEAYQRLYLETFRDPLLREALITEAEFDAAITAMEHGFEEDRFEYQGEFLAVGRVPL